MLLFITLYMSVVPHIGMSHIQKLKLSWMELFRKQNCSSMHNIYTSYVNL